MRMSANWDDPGHTLYSRVAEVSKVSVYVDGILQASVITADTVRGYVIAHEVDEHGHVVLTADRSTVKTKTVRGRVELVCTPKH